MNKFVIYLRLGRVSNLPTVWTNTLAGVVLAGGSLESPQLPLLLIAFTLLYAGGMFLNDAFDREIDARQRPDRPIPAGLISATDVFILGYSMVAVGVLIVIWVGKINDWESAAVAIMLAIAIIGYDAYHKGNPLAPWMMGLCRMLIYVTAAFTVAGQVTAAVACGAVALLFYVAGLTYFAKQNKTLPHTVGSMIAGISLLDALLMAGRGAMGSAGVAVLGFFLTRRWQRSVQGT